MNSFTDLLTHSTPHPSLTHPLQRLWRRYIYLWINYALYEELETRDIERVRAIYRELLKLIPHRVFSFAKIWIMFAHFEIRQRNLKGARQVFGQALGMVRSACYVH